MNSLQGCTGAIKCERLLRATRLSRLALRSKGAACVHGDAGGSTVDTELRLLPDEVGLSMSSKGRLRWAVTRGVGNLIPREADRFDIKEPDLTDTERGVGTPMEPDLVDTEQGVGTPVLVLSSLSQLSLRSKTLAFPPRSLLRRPIITDGSFEPRLETLTQ
jgi:hypothetical protein